ncbi:hypothetical protein ACEWY4_027658 [Coilia grayii]|uniref:small monomeric GTPase n=1 Tax=Coilia grayii TaxID=363190 RepID=A0ABD1IP09_9TELE
MELFLVLLRKPGPDGTILGSGQERKVQMELFLVLLRKPGPDGTILGSGGVGGYLKVKLQIWDTAGQERSVVSHTHITGMPKLSCCSMNITRKSSFDNIRAWLTEIHEYAQKDVVIMLLGNKADMAAERVIRHEEGEKLAKEYGVPFMETSAKDRTERGAGIQRHSKGVEASISAATQ